MGEPLHWNVILWGPEWFNPRMIWSKKNPAYILLNSQSHEPGWVFGRSKHHSPTRTSNFPSVVHCMYASIVMPPMTRQIRARERWNEASNWGIHSDKRCRWLSLPTFNPSKWRGRTLQQWWRLFIQVSVKPVNPWPQHWRSMPDLWQVYEEILSIVWPESCNVIHALFSINLERSFPNKKKVWASLSAVQPKGPS